MAWLTAAQIREKFSIQANRYDTQVAAAIADAALVLRRGLTAEVYSEATGSPLLATDDNYVRQQSVIQAHSFLTMWFLVGNVGSKLGDQGFVKEAQDAGSPAMSGKTISNRYLTPKELEEMKADYLNKARFNLGSYGTIDVFGEEVATEEQQLAVASLQWF